jgi:RNA polymerase sigma-70 factor (ECF subfamily)
MRPAMPERLAAYSEPDAASAEDAGGLAAFGDLVREHQAMVYSIAYHFIPDRATAEEIAQEVFLELHRRRNELESDEHVKYWLRKVAAHRSIDYARRRKRRPKIGIDEIPEPAAASDGSDPLLRQALERLVAGLPEKWRMMIVLRYQEDLEPAEIAALMNVPLGTVKSQLHRALTLLREKLARWKGERV